MPTAVKTARKNPYREILLKKRSELVASVKGEPDALRADSIQTPDVDEFAVKAANQDVAATTLELRSQMLKEIERSLKQMVEGTYGVCEGCGEEISPNRLKAIPWTRYCLACQEQRSKN
jgi:RNA polymerase-binding transcription factor